MLPNWFLSIFADSISYIHLKTKLSKILLSTVVREILWIIDFRQGENVCTFPERWDLVLGDRCIKNRANWSGKYGGVSFQYPVWHGLFWAIYEVCTKLCKIKRTKTTLKQWYHAAARTNTVLVELVILNLCIQCLTEILKTRIHFKIVG